MDIDYEHVFALLEPLYGTEHVCHLLNGDSSTKLNGFTFMESVEREMDLCESGDLDEVLLAIARREWVLHWDNDGTKLGWLREHLEEVSQFQHDKAVALLMKSKPSTQDVMEGGKSYAISSALDEIMDKFFADTEFNQIDLSIARELDDPPEVLPSKP